MTDGKSEMKLRWTVIVIDCGHADCCQRIHYWCVDHFNITMLYCTQMFFPLNYLNLVETNFNKKKSMHSHFNVSIIIIVL